MAELAKPSDSMSGQIVSFFMNLLKPYLAAGMAKDAANAISQHQSEIDKIIGAEPAPEQPSADEMIMSKVRME